MTPCLVRGKIDKNLIIDTLIPPDPGKYSWAGHLGARMQQPVVDEIAKSAPRLDGQGHTRVGRARLERGQQMALSTEMGDAVLEMMQRAAQGDFFEPELEAARPMLETQARLSRIPTPQGMLVEAFRSREGYHLYIYPFSGRHVHLGQASLLAWRLARERPNTFSMSVNGPVRRLSGPAEEHQAAAGVQWPFLRGVPQVRPGQPAADPGPKGSAEPGTGDFTLARHTEPFAAQDSAVRTAAPPQPHELAVDGGAFSRAAHH